MTAGVTRLALDLARDGALPAMITDLAVVRATAAGIRAALPAGVEFYYAAKANPDPLVLAALEPWLDGVEVASAGEIEHLRTHLPGVPLAFGGPAKSAASLAAALAAGVELVHVESVTELRQLIGLAGADRPVDVLLRANPALPVAGRLQGAALVMGGRTSPFGLDPAELDACAALLGGAGSPDRTAAVRFRGLHLHLASGLDAAAHLGLSAAALAWAASWAAGHALPLETVTLGGGMAVDYADPAHRFDWRAEGAGLARLAAGYPGVRLRLEPGRAVTAHAGWYATRVVDVRASHAEWFAVVEGGTHHLRTPAARGHDQPFEVLPVDGPHAWPHAWARPSSGPGPLTVAGALCTPRDVLSRRPEGHPVRAGDVVLFSMAGAYGWNISHHDFLMHPRPGFHHLGAAPVSW